MFLVTFNLIFLFGCIVSCAIEKRSLPANSSKIEQEKKKILTENAAPKKKKGREREDIIDNKRNEETLTLCLVEVKSGKKEWVEEKSGKKVGKKKWVVWYKGKEERKEKWKGKKIGGAKKK